MSASALPAAAPGARLPRARAEAALMPALAGLLLALPLVAAWPGYLSFDSAYQYWQALHGEFGDVAPPLLPLLWRAALQLGLPHGSGPLLLVWLLFVGGFAALVHQAFGAGCRRLAWALAAAGPLCPPLLVLLPHLWTDLLLAAAAVAFAALGCAAPPARPRAWWSRLLLGALLLFVVIATRSNGVLAALPLALVAALQAAPARRRWASALAACVLVALLFVAAQALRRAVVESRVDTWAVSLMFDLQAVSVATGELHLRPPLVGPQVDVAELASAFAPYSGTRLFAGAQSEIADPTVAPLSDEQRSAVLASWRAVLHEPAFWAHRARLFAALVGDFRALRGQAEHPGQTARTGTPALPPHPFPALHDLYRGLVDALFAARLAGAGLPWAAGTLALLLLARRRSARIIRPATMLVASAACYGLPYLLIAPSAELRYLLWPAVAGWLALIALLASPAVKTMNAASGRVCFDT